MLKFHLSCGFMAFGEWFFWTWISTDGKQKNIQVNQGCT